MKQIQMKPRTLISALAAMVMVVWISSGGVHADIVDGTNHPVVTLSDTNMQLEPGDGGVSFAIYGRDGSDGVVNVWGGRGVDNGSGITFYGENYVGDGWEICLAGSPPGLFWKGKYANDIKLRSGDDRKLHYIACREEWDFRNTAITNVANLHSGLYTPILNNSSNVDAGGLTRYQSQFSRVGDVVTVSGRIGVNPTYIDTVTYVDIELPVDSVLGQGAHCAGTAVQHVSGTRQPMSAAIYGNAGSDTARMRFVSNTTTNQSFYYTFTYSVR